MATTDLVLALRSLRRRPLLTGLALLLAALAVGLQAVLASVVSAVLLRPLPYEEPERLVVPWGVVEDFGIDEYPFSWPNFLDYRGLEDSPLESVSATRTAPFTLSSRDRPRSVQGARVTLDLVDTLGLRMQQGSWFDAGAAAGSQAPEAGAVGQVVISDRLWRSELDGSPEAVGATVRLDGIVHTVVGVLPPAARFPNSDTDVLVPLVPEGLELVRAFHFLRLVGRLRDGADLASAQARLVEAALRLAADHPDANDRLGMRLVPLLEERVGRAREGLTVLSVAVQVLFLLACLNVAGLLLARALERRGEMGLRIALGASRWQMLRPALADGLMLAGGGGIAGVAVAAVTVRFLRRLDPELLPRAFELRLDPAALAWACVAVLVAAIAFAAAPALLASRVDPVGQLAPGRGVGDRRQAPWQRRLVAAQVAVTMPLLLGALALIRHVEALQQADLGFPLEHRLTAGVALPLNQFGTVDEQSDFIERARSRLSEIAGVKSVGAISRLPFSPGNASLVAQRPDREIDAPPNALLRIVSEGLLDSLGVELIDGRDVRPADGAEGSRVVVIDETLAGILFPDESPLGRILRLGAIDDEWRVVGIVRAVRLIDPEAPPEPTAWVSSRQNPFPAAMRTPHFVLETAVEPSALAPAVRNALHEVDPEQALLDVRPLAGSLGEWLAARRAVTGLLSSLAAIALLISGIGLYAVLRASVERQRFELGIRAALGAGARRLQRRVIVEALVPVIAGSFAGVALAAALESALRSAGSIPGSSDAATIELAALVPALVALTATAIAASAAPARRVARTDPVVSLRRTN
ncbi:MAG TPA: ABC transporter permease [Thermoanaerobaculia bacterium]|nr:ABC transporter permease [Thermoanaerobaculia bacterium]